MEATAAANKAANTIQLSPIRDRLKLDPHMGGLALYVEGKIGRIPDPFTPENSENTYYSIDIVGEGYTVRIPCDRDSYDEARRYGVGTRIAGLQRAQHFTAGQIKGIKPERGTFHILGKL